LKAAKWLGRAIWRDGSEGRLLRAVLFAAYAPLVVLVLLGAGFHWWRINRPGAVLMTVVLVILAVQVLPDEPNH